MNFLQYVPPSGYATILLEDFYSNIHGILIPEESKRAGYSGRIINVKLTPRQRRDFPPEDEMRGQRCIVKAIGGVQVVERLYKYPVEHIDALLDEETIVEASMEENPRCRFCGPVKSSKQGRLLVNIDGKWFCPHCHRDRNGLEVDPWEIAPPTRAQTEIFTRDLPESVREKVI